MRDNRAPSARQSLAKQFRFLPRCFNPMIPARYQPRHRACHSVLLPVLTLRTFRYRAVSVKGSIPGHLFYRVCYSINPELLRNLGQLNDLGIMISASELLYHVRPIFHLSKLSPELAQCLPGYSCVELFYAYATRLLIYFHIKKLSNL